MQVILLQCSFIAQKLKITPEIKVAHDTLHKQLNIHAQFGFSAMCGKCVIERLRIAPFSVNSEKTINCTEKLKSS